MPKLNDRVYQDWLISLLVRVDIGSLFVEPKNTNNTPPSTSQVNFDITIVFPTPKLVHTDIHMVVVPYI
jgi:hypothetical protein